MDHALSRLLDRSAIQDLLARYARGVDRRDWALVRSTFHEDALDDHGDFKGNVDGFIEWVKRRHATIPQSMHFLGNCLIEFADDDTAVVETYFLALQRLDADTNKTAFAMLGGREIDTSRGIDMEVLGRYVDRMERRHSDWRIARRVVVFEAIRIQPNGGPALNPNWCTAKRDATDPLFRVRAEASLA